MLTLSLCKAYGSKCAILLALLCFFAREGFVSADDAGSPSTVSETKESTAGADAPFKGATDAIPEETDFFDVKGHKDWGTYYDPKNIFCGQYDCYKILGFDYESYGRDKPTTRIITKRYRALSREWHPDKSKHKDAKERFVVSCAGHVAIEST